ncbi:hypothetical protein NEF87_004269 [Candidatus Lokiarchaeum ossiferum]|uniref:Glycosyltransferase family 61 protein n=1 Tax=Candidatus Lokiarchaeum ossiferum TaxID=2951803 RepID=A0ABY6HZV0_9ARCH|nr:hypothetical protein NEF87_004269 [Candidatus Lokiarchaeum sp. B-35]
MKKRNNIDKNPYENPILINLFAKYDTLWELCPKKVMRFLEKKIKPYVKRNIQYLGEFGYELIAVIPFAYWLHLNGKLLSTRSAKDTKCLYYFSKYHVEINKKRKFIKVSNFPLKDIHIPSINTSKWCPPPYKKIYRNSKFLWGKPICVICNKFTEEWGGKPINFLSIEILKEIFDLLKSKYQIIYNRPLSKNIVADDQKEISFPDMQLIEEKYPDIQTIQDLAINNEDLSFNVLQMMLYANCDHFISVQGGSSVFSSFFGGKNIIFAKEGGELRHNSFKWYNKFSGSTIFHLNDYSKLIETLKREYLNE